MSNIKIVRLTSGEELVAEVITQQDGYVLSDIAILIPTQANTLGLSPFMSYAVMKDGIFFKDEHIVFMVEPIAGLLDQYKSMFGKVITPSTSIIS